MYYLLARIALQVHHLYQHGHGAILDSEFDYFDAIWKYDIEFIHSTELFR